MARPKPFVKIKPCATCKTPYPPEDISHDGANCWRCFDLARPSERLTDAELSLIPC